MGGSGGVDDSISNGSGAGRVIGQKLEQTIGHYPYDQERRSLFSPATSILNDLDPYCGSAVTATAVVGDF